MTVIAFIGGGNMAEAILGGLYRSHDHSQLRFSEPLASRKAYLSSEYPDVMSTDDNAVAVEGADVVILAVKPQVMRQVVEGIATQVNKTQPLVISIAAGITTEAIERWLGQSTVPVVRIMPNTPALIGQGAAGMYATGSVTPLHRALTERLMRMVSQELAWVSQEHLMDAVTGVSGSGPAYFFLMMEAMQSAAVAAGLSEQDAKALTLQTCLGAARMAQTSSDDLATLRLKVTSPNGTTEAAIQTLEQNNMRQMMKEAVLAATDRSKALAEELCQDRVE
ncbi:pyrroline-5-carboxylate reductase, partial [Sporodiniella umbellata]